jgi:hypothetical protein
MAIIQNALKIIEEGKPVYYLFSTHRHDFVKYTLKDGTHIFIDGGNDYFRKGGNGFQSKGVIIRDWSLTDKSPLKEVCEQLLWGTYGKNGDKPLTYVPLTTLTQSHLKNILKTQPQIKGGLVEKVIKRLLKKS